MVGGVHVLVLNHNGREQLAECLPSVLACARASASPCQVTVIDNASTDDSVSFLRCNWPDLRVVQLPNHGLASFNVLMREIHEPVAVLLNNDVRIDPGCFDRLAEVIERHPDCLMAGPHCWTFDGQYEGTWSELLFHRGLVHTRLRSEVPAGGGRNRGSQEELRYTASAGAVLAVNREKFLALGGFDPIFLPGRYEDLDLAFRGWLAGWKALYVPAAVAHHRGSATFGVHFKTAKLQELDARNGMLFAWKNLHEPQHLLAHVVFLALRLIRAIVLGQWEFLAACAQAGRRLRQIQCRRSGAPLRVRTESDVFRLLAAPNMVE